MIKPLRVLMVEDSEDDALLTIRELTKGGYEPVYERVETAGAMRTALREKAWDVILCDYRLPQFNGLAAIGLLKETDIDIPLIIVSGAIGEETAVECLRLGAHDYVMKGNLSRLVPAIERELKELKSRLQREQAEEALKRSEQRYRLLVENTNEAIVVVQDDRARFVNRGIEWAGYTVGEYMSISIMGTVHPEDRDAVKQRYLKKICGDKTPTRHTYRALDKGGRIHWIEVSAVLIDWEGRPATLNLILDITDRKKVEDVVTKTAREWQSTFDATNDAIWILDQDQRVLRSNKTAELFFHRPSGEMIGKHCWEIVHGTEQPFPECPILRVRKSLHRETMELQVGERWFEVNVDPILDAAGRYSGAVHVVRDITERKRAEEALRENEELFSLFMRHSPVYTYIKEVTSTESRVLQASDNYEQMIGIPGPKMIGRTMVELFSPEFAAKITADDWAVVSSGNLLQQDEDLNGRSYATIKFPIIQRNKTLLAGYTIDITDRKRTEEQLRHTMESLRNAVSTTIQVVVSAVETRDPYTAGHQIRSANLARAIATEMGLPQEKIDGIRMAGSIHDIGKLSIPAEILSKPTKLSEIEFSLIKEHAQQGFEILKGVESPWPLAEMVYQHHERMDGSGYPRHLKGDGILMEARILAVADVVESMASHRPYRAALGVEAALEEISKNRGILYDPEATDACLRLFQEKGYRLN